MGDNFTPRQQISPLEGQLHPWGPTSPLGSNFAPMGEVKNRPLKSAWKRLND
jgi:hypothetical protein